MIYAGEAGVERLIAKVPRPTTERPTTIAVIGDPHVSTRREGGHRLPETSEMHLERAVADINDRDVDGVFSVGDLSADGGPWDFDAVDRILEDLTPPFVSIPGNHDVPACLDVEYEPLSLASFEERYAGGSVPFVEEFGAVELVGLDSIELRRALNDGEHQAQLDWLAETLRALDDPIVGLHHPLPGITDEFTEYDDRIEGADLSTVWDDPAPLLDVLDRHDVGLVLSGHFHTPMVAQTRGIAEVMAPSTCTFPQGYVLVSVDAGGTEVSFVPVADHGELREAYLRRYNYAVTDRVYATAGAVFLSGPPVDATR